MLHDELNSYFSRIEEACLTLVNCHFEKYDEEIISSDRSNLRIRVRFLNGFLVEINEAIILKNNKIQHLTYRYHFQDKTNRVIFRYDNTPHYPNLPNFPDHKHLPDKVVSVAKPSIPNFISAIKDYFSSIL